MSDATRQPDGAIRVGDFVLDPRSGELRGESARHTLSAQPLNVLLALIERPGGIVTRDELRARLWSADTYVDFEHGLNAVVKRLRDALGDSADTPRYIETVPRRGYRLIAEARDEIELRPEPDGVAVTTVAAPAPVQAAARGWRLTPLAAAALVGVATAAAGLVYLGSRPPARAEASLATYHHPTRFTFGPGLQTDATWSPDGRRIAFAWDRDGNFDIFVQSLDGGDPTRITSSPANDTQPAWSPDGARLVFRSEEDGGGLFTVRAGGGPVRRVVGFGVRPTWMPDGRDIAFAGDEMQTLYLVRGDGGEPPREILKGQLTNGWWASFSVHPDARVGVLGLHPVKGIGFYVSDMAHRRLEPVASQPALLGPPFTLGRTQWNRAGDALFVEVRTDGVPALWRVPVDPVSLAWQTPRRLATGAAGATRSALSPDGMTVAFTSGQTATRAWVFPFDADRGTPPGDGWPVSEEDSSVSSLAVDAEGTAVFYAEQQAGRSTLRAVRVDLGTGAATVLVEDVAKFLLPSRSGAVVYRVARPVAGSQSGDLEYALVLRDAAGRERLISSWGASRLVPEDWRRDGQAVLGTAYGDHPASIVEWPVGASPATAPARVLLAMGSKQFWQGRYSPDGRWVSFVVLDAETEGSVELAITPADGRSGVAWTRIAADHARPDKPRWAPDGRTLYFLSPASAGYFNVWGVRIDPERGAGVGAPFQVTHFDSPRLHVDPDLWTSEIGISRTRLVVPLRSIKGSIWLMSDAGT
jgi:Tol biopolymer transport system component/DNA-binding winged helix-turn-helix (wHTH) protein